VNILNLSQIKKQIQELKNSVIAENTVLCKVFAFRENGLTDAGETEADMKAYSKAYPHTRIVKLFYKNCGRTRNDFAAVETGNTEP
jgi:hypothetical protein